MAYCTQLPPIPQEIIDRFWAKVNKTPTGCWEWQGCLTRGYGRQSFVQPDGKRTYIGAHRFSFLLHGGEIEDGKVIDHLCRNPSCVNPAHLEAVTHRVNIYRGEAPGVILHLSDKCPHGHYYPTNPGAPDRRRACRACKTERDRARRLKKNGRLLAITPRVCVICSASYQSPNASQLTCSRPCSHERKRQTTARYDALKKFKAVKK